MSDNKVKHIFSYVLFAAVLFLALSNSIHNTEYVSNIAKAAIVPLFLIGIIDFFGKVRDKAKQIVTSQIDRNHADYCEAKTRCEDMEVIGGLEETEKYQNWQNAMEQKLSVRTFNDLVYIEIDKTYQSSMKKEEKLKRQYYHLKLNKKQKRILNDYIDCIQINRNRYADISYIAGMRDAIDALCNLGLIIDFDEGHVIY